MADNGAATWTVGHLLKVREQVQSLNSKAKAKGKSASQELARAMERALRHLRTHPLK
jgi:hypothetical protein